MSKAPVDIVKIKSSTYIDKEQQEVTGADEKG